MRRARLIAIAIAIGGVACSTKPKTRAVAETEAGPRPEKTASWPLGSDLGAPRPGMAFIPAGTLHAGTHPDRAPRIADEEMAGVAVEMGGFYIDLLPWPNEPNAIPTTNVSRDEAEQLCVQKQKRLCTELEWERACKGPENTTYEYGDAYRREPCGTGVALEQAARRPSGEHAQCKSKFGVLELHGGAWEWTSSGWGRASKDAAQGVLRGGNSTAGELVGRCANAIARDPAKKAPTMGFRCCAGPKSMAEVHLELQGTPGFGMVPSSTLGHVASVALSDAIGCAAADVPSDKAHGWQWVPVPNEDLRVFVGCANPTSSTGAGCGVGITRGDMLLAKVATGTTMPEVARNGTPRHLRVRGVDARGTFSREITYVYGRIEITEPKRP
ncbi:MAG: SUMF1/EgtB/PvdO family nonheme iron enzyme [Labilithrix sp.]|nr:SUMF1/EgtB/PvdO family nonheme iron enzyme [Labilithrix sp.]MCW5810501.1 SUMF1/EgtB/PvdO family nonheme iron enzyme [Labilithrix sp.]